MNTKTLCCMALALAAGTAGAEPGDFRLVVEEPHPEITEDSALMGYVLVKEGARRMRAVGTVGRAYSLSPDPSNILWGNVAEVINLPRASGSLVGTETAAVNMAHDNQGEVRGLDVVFKNRMDASLYEPVPHVGQNRFNENSAGIVLSSQPRSPAGEYSGWQSGIRFAANSLDRSASRPYAAAIDATELALEVPLYLIVWRCGEVKCGLEPTDYGARIAVDIERR